MSGLYAQDARVAGALIPFQVTGTLMSQGAVQNVVATNSSGSDCRAMVDPYRDHIFLLKCASAATVQLAISVLNNGQIYNIVYGPVSITAAASGYAEISTGSADDSGDPSHGQEIFYSTSITANGTSCSTCHSPADKSGRTAEQIQNAVFGQSAMHIFKGKLSAQDYKDLAAFLGSN